MQHLEKQKNKGKQSAYQSWRARAKEKMAERLVNESKAIIILKFFAAPIIALIGLLILYLLHDFDTFLKVGGFMLAYFFPPAGKETVIPAAVTLGINPVTIALSIAFVDIFVAIFLIWNYDFAKLIPYLGPWMEKIEQRGGEWFGDNPWLENLWFIGLVLFVMVPFQGSGGVAASILGRAIGMNKYKVVLAIATGAIVGCLLIAWFSDLFIDFFWNNMFYGVIILVILIVIVTIYFYRKSRNKTENEKVK